MLFWFYPHHEHLIEIVRELAERGAELYFEGDGSKSLNALDRICNSRFRKEEFIDLVSLFECLILLKRGADVEAKKQCTRHAKLLWIAWRQMDSRNRMDFFFQIVIHDFFVMKVNLSQ